MADEWSTLSPGTDDSWSLYLRIEELLWNRTVELTKQPPGKPPVRAQVEALRLWGTEIVLDTSNGHLVTLALVGPDNHCQYKINKSSVTLRYYDPGKNAWMEISATVV